MVPRWSGLNRLTEGLDADVVAKLEFYNPANSVGTASVRRSSMPPSAPVNSSPGHHRRGHQRQHGIALAMVGAARGYRVILTMPETMSTERRVMLRAYGAQIVLTPGSEGMAGAVACAKQIIAETPNAVSANQFGNPANPAIHEKTTAEGVERHRREGRHLRRRDRNRRHRHRCQPGAESPQAVGANRGVEPKDSRC